MAAAQECGNQYSLSKKEDTSMRRSGGRGYPKLRGRGNITRGRSRSYSHHGQASYFSPNSSSFRFQNSFSSPDSDPVGTARDRLTNFDHSASNSNGFKSQNLVFSPDIDSVGAAHNRLTNSDRFATNSKGFKSQNRFFSPDSDVEDTAYSRFTNSDRSSTNSPSFRFQNGCNKKLDSSPKKFKYFPDPYNAGSNTNSDEKPNFPFKNQKFFPEPRNVCWGGDADRNLNNKKHRNFIKATGENSSTTTNANRVTNSSPTSDETPSCSCNDVSLSDLLAALNDKFSEEMNMIESLDSEVTNTWCYIKEIADVGIEDMDLSGFQKQSNFAEENNFAQPSVSRERTASDEIEVLWQEFESLESKLFQKRNGEKNSNLKSKPAKNSQDEQEILKSKPTKNSQDEQEIEGLKTTIGILTTQLQKDKNNFNTKLDKIQNQLEGRIEAINATLKKEREINKELQEKMKRGYEDMIQTIKAEYTTKLDAHKAEKEELAEQLNLQLNLTESLAKEAEDLRTQMESNKRLTLQTIKETLKDNCECSICLGICTKAVITSCGHTFCKRCLEGWQAWRNENQMCPNCRAVCTSSNIYFFNELITQLQLKFPNMDWIPSS
nr:PREDICTED: E3 ubiquitin-protein ligase BRE1-like isoform X2 [Bemisia tabaci]XP_018910238.1 PREDICTED: E3 ubiquitin-protein ligase BRE1-like isoform X2 [Bemisia tabaci]